MFADAARSQNAVILVDGIENLIEYVPMGPRFAMSILVTLNDLMSTIPPKGRLLVLATTSRAESLEELGALDVFDRRLFIPAIDDEEQVAGESWSMSASRISQPAVRLFERRTS